MTSKENRIAFVADYYDPQANMIRQYQLLYYTHDATIEMHDLKNKRVFLKRCPYPSLDAKELYVGSTITIFARQLRLSDFGDEATRKHFAANAGEFIFIIHGKGMNSAGSIIQLAMDIEIRISNIRLCEFSPSAAKEMNVSPRCIVVHASSADASKKAETLAAKFLDFVRVLIDDADCRVVKEIAFTRATTARMKNCAVCVIKPHAINSRHAGAIIQRLIDEGFEISALASFTMTMADSEDFLEVYKGVIPEYRKLVEHFASAPCWAIEVRAENAVDALRGVCGPHDPEICHALFPHTLRAKFGVDRTKNAVHCTDLSEDGPLESEFFFSLMLNKP
jgi:nucleoside-diphosphate kinase